MVYYLIIETSGKKLFSLIKNHKETKIIPYPTHKKTIKNRLEVNYSDKNILDKKNTNSF